MAHDLALRGHCIHFGRGRRPQAVTHRDEADVGLGRRRCGRLTALRPKARQDAVKARRQHRLRPSEVKRGLVLSRQRHPTPLAVAQGQRGSHEVLAPLAAGGVALHDHEATLRARRRHGGGADQGDRRGVRGPATLQRLQTGRREAPSAARCRNSMRCTLPRELQPAKIFSPRVAAARATTGVTRTKTSRPASTARLAHRPSARQRRM